MYLVPVSAEELLTATLAAAEAAAYESVVFLLARQADVPETLRRAIEDWSSLHFLTDDLTAVIAPALGAEGLITGGPMGLAASSPLELHRGGSMMDTFSETFWTRIKDVTVHRPPLPVPVLDESQGAALPYAWTKSVKDMLDYFGLVERDVPSLLFVAPRGDSASLVHLSDGQSLYGFLKGVVELKRWEPDRPLGEVVGQVASEQLHYERRDEARILRLPFGSICPMVVIGPTIA